MKKLLYLFLGLIIIGCGNIEPDWTKYDPQLKSRIDSLNCDALQKEFNTAEANSDMQRARTGTGNSLLMGYIDDRMREKGCYQ